MERQYAQPPTRDCTLAPHPCLALQAGSQPGSQPASSTLNLELNRLQRGK